MKIKRILGSIVLIGYLASELLSHLGYVDRGRAEAASNGDSTTSLVAVLIDNDTYNSIGSSSNFSWYTNGYLHSKYPGSQAVILPIDTQEYTAPEIVKLLENIYFDGLEDKASRLVGLLLVGEIPFPVVKYQDYIFPSIYPYVDFIDQKYIRSDEEKYFTLNKADGQAELWHGVLNFEDSKKYDEFFEKLKKYQNDPEKFIEKKIWYDDFISLNKNFLEEVYRLYQNRLMFAEDLMYHRYTNFFVNILKQDQEDSYSDLLGGLSEQGKALGIDEDLLSGANAALAGIDNNDKNNDTPTLLLQNKITGFIKNYYEVLSTPLLRTIDDNIKASDRWEVNDSHYQKMQLKDQLLLGNESANGILKSINDKLELYVDQKIEDEKYSMKTTVPIYFYEGKDKRKRILFKKRYIPQYKNTYQFFYFGQDAETITNAEQFSIYRGSYRNLRNFVKYSSIVGDRYNPAKTSEDKTDLTKKGVGSSYDIFSTQVESNRGYNALNMQSEYEIYNKEKIHARRERECVSWLFGIHWNILCMRKEWKNEGSCEIGGDETGCEDFVQFGNRVYGGGTPLNLDMEAYQEKNYKFEGEYDYKNALKPLYDIAGSVGTTSAIDDVTSFQAYKTRISPTLISDKYGNVLGSDQHLEADYHINPSKVWFFNNSNLNLNGFKFTLLSNDSFELKKEKSGRTDDERIYRYRVIPSIVKHDAAQGKLINGYSGYRYTGDKETYTYYKSIIDALEVKESTGVTDELVDNFSHIEELLSGLGKKIRMTPGINTSVTWEYNEELPGLAYTGLDELVDYATGSEMSGMIYSSGQADNWDKFNILFGNNYGEDAFGLIDGYHNRQIERSKKIDIWSVWYNEIIDKFNSLENLLSGQAKIGSGIFDTYNRYYEYLTGSLSGVDERIEALSGRIATGESIISGLVDELIASGVSVDINDISGTIQRLEDENTRLNEENTLLQEENNRLYNEIHGSTGLEQQIIQLNADIDTSNRNIAIYSGKILECEANIPNYDPVIYEIATNTGTYYDESNTGVRILNEANRIITKSTGIINTCNRNIATNTTNKTNAENLKQRYQQEIIGLTGEARAHKQAQIDAQQAIIDTAEKNIKEEQKKITEEQPKLNTATQVKSYIDTCNDYPNKIAQERSNIANYEASISSKQNEIDTKNRKIQQNKSKIDANKRTIKNNNESNEKLEKIIRIMQDIEATSGALEKWKIVRTSLESLVDIVDNLNISDPCMGNHEVLGDIIGANSGDIKYLEVDDSSCEIDSSTEAGDSGNNPGALLPELLQSLKDAKTTFQKYFKSDPDNPEERITGVNMLTPERAIDSPRYVTFQGVGENVIKLIYPNVFKVEIYKSTGSNILLKETDPNTSKDEIYQALVTYFQNKVYEYNRILSNERNGAKSMGKEYNFLYNKVDPLATPTLNANIRPYKAFTYQEMVDAIGGDNMLHTLSELLYYQNVSNRMREYLDDVGEDIKETRNTFDINKKISYIVKEYLTEDNDKFYKGELNAGDKKSYAGLIIPGYSTGGYEVGYINSNGNDNVTPGFDETENRLNAATRGLTNTNNGESTTLFTDNPANAEANQDFEKDCGFDINQALLLYNFKSGKFEWFEGLSCWIEAVSKKPVTLKIYFETSPTLSSISEPIEESLTDFKDGMKQFGEDMDNFLNPSGKTIDTYQNMPTSSKNMSEKTKKIVNYTQVSWSDKKVSVLGRTGTLNFVSLEDLGNITVKIQTTGDNCLIINGVNTCNGTDAIINNKNPYKAGFSTNFSLAKDTVGTIMASVSLCSSANDCGVKNMSLTVVPGPISKFEVTPQGGNKILAGAYTLLSLKAMDEKNNEIQRSLENYIIKVDKGKIIIGGIEGDQQEINDFKNSTLLYRADAGTNGTVTFSIEDTKGNVLARNTANVFPGELKLKYNGSEVQKIKYTISNEKYFNTGANGDMFINTKKIIPIKVSLSNGSSTIPVTTNALLGSSRGLIKIMLASESKDSKGRKKISLRDASSINIFSGETTIYVVPLYTAGEDELIVSVPGLEEKRIGFSLLPGEMKSIGITLAKDTINPEETITGTINLTDAWGNKIDKTTNVSIETTTENMVEPIGKVRQASVPPTRFPAVSSGEWNLTLKTTPNDLGLQRITVKGQDKDGNEITTTKSFMIRKFFIDSAVESGLNILYLNLFGSDWGNQWGYGSDNKKYSEHIIESSKKTLAVTTQLIDPSKIKETSIVFGKDGNLQNNGNHTITAHLNNARLQMNINKIGTFEVKDPLKNIKAIKNDISNEWLLELIQEDEKSLILYNINESFIYNNGKFYTKEYEFADMKSTVNFEITTNSIGGYPIWEAKSNGQILGSVVITNLDFSTIEGDVENIDYEIGDLYNNGSTLDSIKALYSRLNTLADNYQGYDSIQNSAELDKYIGFRGNFKNITLFAEGESVGEATIPYGSEFLINIGDPLLKNRDEVASNKGLGQVKFTNPGKTISKVVDIDYNNDGFRDLLIIYKDGSIVLQKQYDNKKYQDLGTLMVSAESIQEAYVGDVDGNKYEDLIIKNSNNQLRVYTNDNGVFDVDGNIVCLNTNVPSGEISEHPENLSGVLQFYVEDMDNDGRMDIVTLDKRGYLKIFYGYGSKTRHSYLSKEVYSCDDNWYDRGRGQTKLVKKLGLQLSNNGVADSSILRWDGLKYPSDEDIEKQVIEGNMESNGSETELEKLGISTDPSFLASLEGSIGEGADMNSIIKQVVEVASQIDTTAQAQKATQAGSIYIKNPFIGKYEFKDGIKAEEQAFLSMSSVVEYNKLTNTKRINKPEKKYVDVNGGDLEEGDIVEVTVSSTASAGYIPTSFFDQITGPWVIERNESTGAPKDLKFTKGTGTIVAGAEGYDYGLINILPGGNGFQIKYSLTYHMASPLYTVRVEREDPLIDIASVGSIEKDDITIVNWNGLKYEDKHQDILIKNPFGNQIRINDGLNAEEQAYINIDNIGSYINRLGSKEIYSIKKSYKDTNGGRLENGDKVEVTVKVAMPKSHIHLNTYIEKLEGPWNERGIPGGVTFTKGSGTVKNGIGGYSFYLTNFEAKEESNGDYAIEFKYTLTYKDSNGTPNTKNLPFIVLQPVDGCVKQEEVLENAKTSKNRDYNSKIIDLQELANEYAKEIQEPNTEANDNINNEIINAQSLGTDNSSILNSIKENYGVNDILGDAWEKLLDGGNFDLGSIDLDITNILGVDINNVQRNVQDLANKLCNGFTFGKKGSKSCEGLPVPFNQAFLAPGSYHIMGCIQLPPLTRTLGKGLPIFFWPGNLGPIPFVGYLPIPYMPTGSSDGFLRVQNPSGPWQSMIRIYAAPTLTAQLGLAICVGPYNAGINMPSPIADIAGNCIVTAMSLPCGSSGGDDGDDGDGTATEEEEAYEAWVAEYGKTNACVPSNNESPFTMVASNGAANVNEGSRTTLTESKYFGGNVNINQDTTDYWFSDDIEWNSPANDSSLFDKVDGDSGLEINGVKIQGVKDMKNKLLGGLQQGIQKILVDWVDRQVQYWINNLFRFEIEFTFPDISYLADEINKISTDNISNITKPTTDKSGKPQENKAGGDGNTDQTNTAEQIGQNNKKANLTGIVDRIKKINVSKDNIRELNLAGGANPFKELEELFNQTDLINITTQDVTIRVPWIYNEDIEAYKNYLLTWYDQNATIIKGWEAAIEVAIADCSKKEKAGEGERTAVHCQALQDAKAKITRLSSKFDKTGDQIFSNVQTLEAYKRFPFEIYEWLHVVDKYLGDISALVANFFGYINFWMDVNATRFTQYVDAIITIVTIVKTYQIIIDLFADWGAKCGKCTQDTYDQYSCKLSFLCMINIPTIAIPAVKIPSLYIDFSHLNLEMNVTLPRFNFQPEGVELPRLPNLPEPPQLGINFDIDFDIPDIPQLPQPPELPELPSFIPQVKLELPVLPPAPKIPEIPSEITGILTFAKTLSKIFCIIKSGIGLVSESAVKARIEQMTQRSYEVPRVDNLDLTAYFKQAPLQGVDIQVDSFVNLQFNFDAFYAFLKGVVDEINNLTYQAKKAAETGIQYVNQTSAEWTNDLNNATNKNINFNVNVSENITPEELKLQLTDLYNTLTDTEDKKKVNEVIAYVSTDTTVKPNTKGLSNLEKQVNAVIESEKKSLDELSQLISGDYDSFLAYISNSEDKQEKPLQLTFSTNLLDKNEKAEQAIKKNNATDLLVQTEEKNVNGYISALNNHTAGELNMTQETYDNAMRYLASIKGTIDNYYSVKRSEYAGNTTLTDSLGQIVRKPLLAQLNGTTETTDTATQDYSQYVKGVFIKSGDNLVNAVNSEYNYEKFQSYYEKDLDKDGKTELIMWDANNVFVKYFDGEKNGGGKDAIVVRPSLKNKKRYASAGGIFSSTNIKVYDENAEVKNFTLRGQTYESIAFSWDNIKENTSGYLMRLVERVDGLWEKNSQNSIKYILFLPDEMEGEIDDKTIELQGNSFSLSNAVGKKIYSIKYYNEDQDILQFTLGEVPRKREYVQVCSLNFDESKSRYQQNSPRSNQLVGGRQVVGDGDSPKATVELLREKKGDEVVDEGFDLEGYVGTYYTLKITWEDSTKIRDTKLEVYDEKNNTGKVLNEKDFDSFVGVVRLEGLFFTGSQTKIYNIYAVDSQGNETEEQIKIGIKVPGITIENVERFDGYKEGIKGPVSITSELETDIDKGTVSFERNRNNETSPIKSTAEGEQNMNYEVTTDQTTVIGQYYDFGDEIGLYSQDNKQIATIDGENGNIQLKPEYASQTETRVDFSQGYPIVKLMQGNKILFEVLLQPESLISREISEGYTVLQLQGNNYGLFNGGEVIMKNKDPLLYIAPDGTLFTQSALQGNYIFNSSDNTVTYEIYETLGNKIASVTFKVKPLE